MIIATRNPMAVKFDGTVNRIAGWGAPFGGDVNGRDRDGQSFHTGTDFALAWFKERPLLIEHGLSGAGHTVVGRVTTVEKRDKGLWIEAMLDKSSPHYQMLQQKIAGGKLFFSSGSMSHLVKVQTSTGKIDKWPLVEVSLTEMPSNRLATIDEVKSHFLTAGLKFSPRVSSSTGGRHFYKLVHERCIPDDIKWTAKTTGWAVIGELDIPDNVAIRFILPEDIDDKEERRDCEFAGKAVPWESLEFDEEIHGSFKCDGQSRVIYVRGDLDERATKRVVAHELFHLDDANSWGARPNEPEKRNQMEREATRYATAFLAADDDGHRWNRQTRQQYLLYGGY